MDYVKISKKWQERWEKDKIFEANPDKRKKFFANAPYPYVNAFQHVGHLYTYMRTEALARYKRLQGFNVLYPQGFHATGSPIVQAAKRVREKEPKQLKIMKDMGFKNLKKFEKPEYWVEYFVPEFIKDYKSLGMSIDWRRQFHTTDLNPHYDKFIRWQFNILKEKNYVIKGKFPVVWDPKENLPVGDHDRVEGEGETPQEFLLVKHKLDDRFVVSATLRQDTILGITNLFVHPNIEYKEVEINNEKWIIGDAAIQRLKEQDRELKVTGSVKGIELIGKKTEEVDGHKVLILPATFLDPDFGTGLVHSVPSDSADDLIALQDLQKDEGTLKKYKLDVKEVKAIKPIPVLDTPGYGDVPAQKFLDKYKVKNQNERKKLDEIKKELYKLSFHTATFNEKYKKMFSKNLHKVKIEDGKDIIKKDFIKMGWVDTYYQLTGKVVSRSLTECVVKIVDDQWFLNYDDPKWKKLAHKCLDKMKLYPEKARSQFDYVIDWLHEWACTREEGLGTRLPWDEKWLIESLSDSTIYMAYYTFVHLLERMPIDQVDDNLFDYILLGKHAKLKCDKKLAEQMRKEFEYWYPFEFRNSGKDLIQNHLTFSIFNHVAIFQEKYWPKGFGTNGWVTVDGQKMSKSLGNMIPVREIVSKFSPDVGRLTILAGGESLDDPNWDTSFAEALPQKFDQMFELCDFYNKGVSETSLDAWMESQLNRNIKEATEAMEETLFRTAIQRIFFDLNKAIRTYLRRNDNKPNKELYDRALESLIIMLNPFTPHFCEELWEKLGKKDYVSLASWPDFNEKKIDEKAEAAEDLVQQVRTDIIQVLKLVKVKPNKITLFVSPEWKYDFIKKLKTEMKNTRNPGEIMKKLLPKFKANSKELSKTIPSLVNDPKKLPQIVTNQKLEVQKLESEIDILGKEFSCNVEVATAEKSQNPKASKAMPGKPGIQIE